MHKVYLILLTLCLLPLLANAQDLSSANIERGKQMQAFHQEMAVNLFNQSWDLLLKEGRTRQDEDILLNTVHASLYHWRQIGQPISILRGEWMICHVYTLLEHKDMALYHAENILRLKDEIKTTDWDLAYCYEAMARVQALRGNKEEFHKYLALALEAGKNIAQEGDRQQFEADMNDGFWFGMR